VAYYEKLEGAALAAYRQTVATLVAKAQQELKLSRDQIVTRMLRPEDIGLPNAASTFNITSANAWNTIIDEATIGDSRFVSINGILLGESGTSVVTQLKITRSGEDVRYWQIQDVNFLESPIIWFDDPVTIDQNTTLTIKAWALATDSEWRCTFLGAVAEKKGLLVK